MAKKKKSHDEFITECVKTHGDTYDYAKTIYTGIKDTITVTCMTHGDYEQRAFVHRNGSGCPKCRNRISKPALEWLTSIGVTQLEKYIPEIRRYADGYDPITNTVYLFHGDYWHGNPDVYSPEILNSMTKSTFGELYQNTLKVEQLYRDQGYNVDVQWENDWKKGKKRKVNKGKADLRKTWMEI